MSNGRRRLGAEKINFATNTASSALVTRQGLLYGWAWEETTGLAVAQVELLDGDSDNGDRIVPITLLANESTRDIWGWPGIWCDRGVYVRVIAGSVRGTIYYQPLSPEEAAALYDRGYPGMATPPAGG